MMDRELLELAAKAAGYELIEWTDLWQGVPGHPRVCEQGFLMLVDESRALWNPLVNDGDALRLAVKLGLHIDCAFLCAMPKDLFGKNPDDWSEGSDIDSDDECELMRRAIVHAVAKIGKSIP
ncbi:hypothetical protein [Pseudomonas sp. SBB6]|uniref:hypothetical protein n=1 Tax=Pseudomonas sp. SBB6 TaxID=2962032 RepID=UPI0020B68F81|nr:hypothetical protein [Pseudomonas sp. SBB6]MCP3752564.1 hypothetical protein [Pseudomonas sp. SBB6]